MELTIVLTNWKRPKNLPIIVEAFRKQTTAPIWLVDNAAPEFRLRSYDIFDNVILIDGNAGPWCRMAAAPLLRSKYVLFYDDDLRPGRDAIEHLWRAGKMLNWRFATLGEIGRRIEVRDSDLRLVKKNVPRSGDECVKVDLTCRAHLVRVHHLPAAQQMYADTVAHGASEAELRNDDILLCCGIQRDCHVPSYLTYACANPNALLRCEDLPDNHALSAAINHTDSRNALINRLWGMGWGSWV